MLTTQQSYSETYLSQELLEKYNTHGPRYTSYPTAPLWSDSFGPLQYQEAITLTNQETEALLPLSLYTHLPFCESRCLYCSCNIVITQQRKHSETYLQYLFKEIDHVSRQIDPKREVVQFHWGGGTPTYLSCEQIERLFQFYQERFIFSPDAEIAIEIDPRVTTFEQLGALRDLGFNRVSLGVQDFDPKVQETVHRVQPIDMTQAMVEECRRLGFESVNFDLIYGLPYQSVDTFEKTLEAVIRIAPDRIALYNYAYVPWMSPHQKLMPEEALPSGNEKFKIFRRAIQMLTESDYLYIGMDHFAKPNDELSLALQEKRLHRNFMGYTVQKVGETEKPETDLYAFGVSAISGLQRYYAQNQKKLTTYYKAIDEGTLPTLRGYALSDEDELRRKVILAILCQGDIEFDSFSNEFKIDFQSHFQEALKGLAGPVKDGLVVQNANGFYLTPLGRIFSRNIAMLFDAYLKQQKEQGKDRLFSKTL